MVLWKLNAISVKVLKEITVQRFEEVQKKPAGFF